MIHIYTGNGKGKTTAALGLAVRAAGASKKVYIGQFIKGRICSELQCLRKIKAIKIEQFGTGCFIKNAPSAADIKLAQKGFEKIKKAVNSRKYDVVILDEINCALTVKLLNIEDVLELLKNAPAKIELVLTGRNAPRALIDAADLVSEIRQIKHYYNKKVKARPGIEY